MKKSTENSEENLVKKTCRELGITQKELAEITKIDKANISRWNSNQRKIPSYIEIYLETLLRLNHYEKVI
jgi:transcriptional regulator with XRE-family HTH domain